MIEDYCYACKNLYGGGRQWACFEHHTLNDDFIKPKDCSDFDFTDTIKESRKIWS